MTPRRTAVAVVPLLTLFTLGSSAHAAPEHNMCVPRAVGVPTREGPPKWLAWSDAPTGAVDPQLDDPRWLGSTGHSFSLGSAKAPLQTRALWSNDGGKEYLHLSFIVDVSGYNIPPQTESQATSRDIFVGFRRATALPNELGYIFQFHLKDGNEGGVVRPDHCAQFAVCASGGTGHKNYWRAFIDKGQVGTCGTTGNDGEKYERFTGATVNDPPISWMTGAAPAQDAVRYWKLAPSASAPFSDRWAVQLRIPIVDAGHPITEGIERGSTFWYQATAELPTQPTRPGGRYATVGWFPRELTTPICPETALADFLVHEELGSVNAACPLCSPDKFSNLTTSAPIAAPCDGGIELDHQLVGAVFNPSAGTDFALINLSNQFKATTPGGAAAPNVVVAQPRNTTNTPISAPLLARFRLAAWGSAPWSNPLDTGRWKDMRGAAGGVCGAGTAPACTPITIPAKTSPTGGRAAIKFTWQIGNDTTLGPSEYCKYGLTPPTATQTSCVSGCACGAQCDAPTGTGIQASGPGGTFPCVTPTYQFDQCMLVELSAPNGTANFVSQSTWNNMTFQQMSIARREALIDARDLPKAPGQRYQDIYLIAMPRNMPGQMPAGTKGQDLVRGNAMRYATEISKSYSEDYGKLTAEEVRRIACKLGRQVPNDPQGCGEGSGSNEDVRREVDVERSEDPAIRRHADEVNRLRQVRVIMDEERYQRVGKLLELATSSGTAEKLTEQAVTLLGASEAAEVVPTLDIYPFYQHLGKGAVYQPMTSFTVFLSHEGDLAGIEWLIDGATRVGANVFHLQIPVGYAKRVQVQSQAIQPPERRIGPSNPRWPCAGGCACGGGARNCGLVAMLGNTVPGLVAGVFVIRRRRRKKPARSSPGSKS